MVRLEVHNAPLPRRYWGEGQGPVASPSQASLLLARLNERARERKAGVGKGTPRRNESGVGKDTPRRDGFRVGQGGTEVGQKTPERTTPKKDGVEVTPVSQHQHRTPSPPPPLSQASGDAKPKVNGVKMEVPWTVEVKGKKRKKRKDKETEEGDDAIEDPHKSTSIEERLTNLQDEGTEISITRKKEKKQRRDKEESLKEEELKGVATCQEEGLEGTEAPVTKKKKKKRKRQEEEEEEKAEEEVVAKAVIGIALDSTEESGVIKKQKKKKRNEESINEEGTSAGIYESFPIKKEVTERDYDKEVEENKGKRESFSKRSENQHKKRRKEEKEMEQKNMDKEDRQESKIYNTDQQTNDIFHSPKMKGKMYIKQEPKEDERQQNITCSIKVPKIKIKEEIVAPDEELEAEQQEEPDVNNHIEGENEEEARGKEGEEGKLKKRKKKKAKKKKAKKLEGKGKSREVGGFTLLTEVEATRRQKVHRTLPHWLANPTVIGRDLMADGTPVDTMPGLDPSLKAILKQHSVQQLFPVQCAVIPEILASAGTLACRFRPRDVCVSAPTGSGKTLAYVLPLVQALRSRMVPRIRALILLPVQELATQVFHVFQKYCRGTPLRVGKAVGHSTLQKEQTALVAHHLGRHHSLVDILVATPGRLADHLRITQGLDLSALRYLVLDEADRMLAAEGGDWVSHVQRAIADHRAVWEGRPLPQPPLQRLLFSATLSSDPEQLQHVTLYHPKLFTVATPAAGQDKSAAVVIGQFVRPAELKEEYVVVEEEVKPLALHHLLVSGEGRHRVLIFTNSVQATHKLSLLLATLSQGSGRVVSEFSSKRDKRQQILSQFTSGKIDVLVSSDAMARGLDIPDIDHVVSYDVTATTTYVHRIGRTARAGRPGTALSLITKATMSEFRRALSGGGEGACQLTLTPEELEPYEEQYIAALGSLRATMEEEERQKRQNQPSGKAKKNKKKQQKKKRQRNQKKDMRTTRLAQNKARVNKGKVSIKASRLRHHLKGS